ncbi:MAG TPA: HEAT repeat domain-containing protein [Phycisphaerae bacterium]|nr:HEAT repeat domain-containing protein [Phycisphaerae bacterium]
MKRIFSRFACIVSLLVMVVLLGCSTKAVRGPMDSYDQTAFRSAAIHTLEEAAFGESPSQRMQALEAFKEVAPCEGISLKAVPLNIENAYPGASFAALMAAGESGATHLEELARTRAEHPDANVRLAALFALHQFGDKSRTSEIAGHLLNHRDARVRANAAYVIGKMGGKQQIKLLKIALRKEQKDLPKLQILEALSTLGDKYASERLIFEGYSEIPQQSAVALMMLANARCEAAESLFWLKMHSGKWPEVRLQAARGLARLGYPQGLKLGMQMLSFNAPQEGIKDDPPEQQIRRVRGLAALALESIADPEALGPLKRAFDNPKESEYVKIAVARAVIKTIDRCRPQPDEGAAMAQRADKPHQVAAQPSGDGAAE